MFIVLVAFVVDNVCIICLLVLLLDLFMRVGLSTPEVYHAGGLCLGSY